MHTLLESELAITCIDTWLGLQFDEAKKLEAYQGYQGGL